jgi:aryl-alcohol dehydrogenase-like predicted oxidoreductase
MLPQRSLGANGPSVSVMSLGSWRTFERISREEGLRVMRTAREAGVTLLDDARYDDETGVAPMPTGWSEVVFGELFRGTGWDRDAVTVCNKLWWEHWPDQDAVTELDGSLRRMSLEHVDVIYAIAASTAPPVKVVVEQVAGLISSGRAHAWGTGMWSGQQLTAALDVCDATGAPYPIAAQMACSLADHRQSADPEVNAALERGGIGLVAAYVLAGGTLTGKYASRAGGRAADDTSPAAARGKEIGVRLAALAADWDVPTAHLAFAYALDHRHLATVLFGATSAEQVRSNVGAVATYESLDDAQRAAIAALA